MPFEMNLHNVEASLSVTLCRIVLIAITGDPLFYGIDDIIMGTGYEKMVFADTIETWVLWVGIAIGVVALTAIGYWFKYQDYQMKNPEESIKFEVRYIVAAVLTVAVSVLLSYVIVFYGLGYFIDTPIAEIELAIAVSAIVGAVVAYLVDAAFFHPLADGIAAQAYVKSQALVREQLATEEAQKAIAEAIVTKAKQFGVTTDAQLNFIKENVKSVDDPNFIWVVNYIMNNPPQ